MEKIRIYPILNLDPGKMAQVIDIGNATLTFDTDSEGGLLVSEDGCLGNGQHISIRYQSTPTASDLERLSEKMRLSPFENRKPNK